MSRRCPGPVVSGRLAGLVPAGWPDVACLPGVLDGWEDAAVAWLAGGTAREPRPGGGVWWRAGGTRRALPSGGSGGAIDLLREEICYRGEISRA